MLTQWFESQCQCGVRCVALVVQEAGRSLAIFRVTCDRAARLSLSSYREKPNSQHLVLKGDSYIILVLTKEIGGG